MREICRSQIIILKRLAIRRLVHIMARKCTIRMIVSDKVYYTYDCEPSKHRKIVARSPFKKVLGGDKKCNGGDGCWRQSV